MEEVETKDKLIIDPNQLAENSKKIAENSKKINKLKENVDAIKIESKELIQKISDKVDSKSIKEYKQILDDISSKQIKNKEEIVEIKNQIKSLRNDNKKVNESNSPNLKQWQILVIVLSLINMLGFIFYWVN